MREEKNLWKIMKLEQMLTGDLYYYVQAKVPVSLSKQSYCFSKFTLSIAIRENSLIHFYSEISPTKLSGSYS